jgi:hypothetical protein
MARPYPAGGVSIAQSNPTCRRPAAPWPHATFQKSSGPTFPPYSRHHPFSFLQAISRDLRQRESVWERGSDPWGPLSRICWALLLNCRRLKSVFKLRFLIVECARAQMALFKKEKQVVESF